MPCWDTTKIHAKAATWGEAHFRKLRVAQREVEHVRRRVVLRDQRAPPVVERQRDGGAHLERAHQARRNTPSSPSK